MARSNPPKGRGGKQIKKKTKQQKNAQDTISSVDDIANLDVEQLMRGDFLGNLQDQLTKTKNLTVTNVDSVPAGKQIKKKKADEENTAVQKLPKKKQKKGGKVQLKQAEEAESSSSTSGSDEEDDEETLLGHSKELEKLAEQDPEFYEYLKKNDSKLLDFEMDDEDEGDDDNADGEGDSESEDHHEQHKSKPSEDEEGEEGEDNDEEKEEQETMDGDSELKQLLEDEQDQDMEDAPVPELTMEKLEQLEHSAFVARSGKGLRKLAGAFRAGAFLGAEAGAAEGGALAYGIADPEVHAQLMSDCLKGLHEVFIYHLLEEEKDSSSSSKKEVEEGQEQEKNKNKKKKKSSSQHGAEKSLPTDEQGWAELAQTKRFKALRPVLRAFWGAATHLLESTDVQLHTFVLGALRPYLPLLAPLPRASRLAARALLGLWAAVPASPAEARRQFLAFATLRRLAAAAPGQAEPLLRGMYLHYARLPHGRLAARGAGAAADQDRAAALARAAPRFMANCLVEALGQDLPLTYQLAYGFIRQLGLHLRNALLKKSEEAVKRVYGWPYLRCLQLWAFAAAAHCGEHELRPLVYPLAEIIFGVIKLIPSFRFVPLRFFCIKLLQRLAASAEVYMPSSQLLLDVLVNPDIQKKPKLSTAAAPDLATLYKFAKDGFHTHAIKDAVVSEAMSLLSIELEIYKYNASFPELFSPIAHQLRRFVKSTKFSRWKAFARGLIETYTKYSQYVCNQRLETRITPGKAAMVFEVFRPNDDGILLKERILKILDAEGGDEENLIKRFHKQSSSSTATLMAGKVEEKDDDIVVKGKSEQNNADEEQQEEGENSSDDENVSSDGNGNDKIRRKKKQRGEEKKKEKVKKEGTGTSAVPKDEEVAREEYNSDEGNDDEDAVHDLEDWSADEEW